MVDLKSIFIHPFRMEWYFHEESPYGDYYNWSVETTKTGDFLCTDLSPEDEGRLDSSMDVIKKWTSGLQEGVVTDTKYYLKSKSGITSAYSSDKDSLIGYYGDGIWEDAKLMKETTIISEVSNG